MLSQSSFDGESPITTGPERVESSIESVLRSGGTRSELRALVDRFADLARVVGMSPGEAVARLEAVAVRAATDAPATCGATAVGDSIADRRAMMKRWCSARYQRAD
ncbi:MAG TPA: hypothetical protein VFP15_08520 [Gemmatimonadaceae bacterium]|nr:hypothetical protein [Gemmatimonadaceae bacterium]